MNDTESLRAELQYIWSNGDYRQVVRKNSVPFSLDSNILHLTSPVHTFVDVWQVWKRSIKPGHLHSPFFFLAPLPIALILLHTTSFHGCSFD